MKYLIPLILLLICGCSPPSDPELKEIWWKDQAIVLVDGTNNTTLVPHSEGWMIEIGQVVNTSVLYSIKDKDPNNLYVLRKDLPNGGVYKVIKVYSQPLEKMHNETKPSLVFTLIVLTALILFLIIPPLILLGVSKPNE
jgi:hypothetical protein